MDVKADNDLISINEMIPTVAKTKTSRKNSINKSFLMDRLLPLMKPS